MESVSYAFKHRSSFDQEGFPVLDAASTFLCRFATKAAAQDLSSSLASIIDSACDHNDDNHAYFHVNRLMGNLANPGVLYIENEHER
jgi:hypothetical protein